MPKILTLSILLAGSLSAEIYELRTYFPHEGKMENLLSRFRDHTTTIFETHGIKNVGYWLADTEDGGKKLIYLVAHQDEATAKENWKAFKGDPKWKAAYKESTVNGKLVRKITSEFLTATDFSKLK